MFCLRVIPVDPRLVARDDFPIKFSSDSASCSMLFSQASAMPSVRRWEFAEQILQQHVACSNLVSVWPSK
jgi:hypothetical protein